MSSVREKILTMLSGGERPAADVHTLGSRSFVAKTLNALIAEKLVYKHGRGKLTTYSLSAKQGFPAKKVQAIKLPDLPPLMLWWGGYTDKEPDPHAGEYVQGGQWS